MRGSAFPRSARKNGTPKKKGTTLPKAKNRQLRKSYKCDLRGAKMADAKLAAADLRSSNIDGARIGIKELQGAIVNIEQAVSIARALGVDVRLE